MASKTPAKLSYTYIVLKYFVLRLFWYFILGDSGGGLYINDTFGGKVRYMVVGITSYGDGCGQVNSPGWV